MMQTARAITPVTVLFLTAVSLAAWNPVPIDSLYTTPIELETGKTITRTADSISDTGLMPEQNGLRAGIENELEEIRERIIVESLRLVAIPRGVTRESESQEQLTVANILRDIESMEGIEYYSERRDRMRTLFAKSTRIPGPENTEAAPYEPVTTIPHSETVYALQEDLTFGENIYRFQYESLANAQLLSIENLNRLSYGILPAIGSGNLRMFVAAIPVEQGLLFYGAAVVQVPTLFGLGNRIAISFENRVNALAQWFEDMLENV